MHLLRYLRERKRLTRALAVLGGMLLAILLGFVFYSFAVGEPIARLSYDLPFLWRSTLNTDELVLVYLDEIAARELNQPIDDRWNRSLHAQLIDRLREEKSRLILYDVIFDLPAPDPATDDELAAAMQRHGKVVLGAAFDIVQSAGQAQQERVSPPIRLLRKAAAGYGLMAFWPVDPDYGVRQIFLGTSLVPSATWKASELLGGATALQSRDALDTCWINYYGPRDTFSSVSIAQALQPGGAPAGFFKNKIVLVGGRSILQYLRANRDEFATPYSRISRRFTPGLEVHATILLNLLHGEWLRRASPRFELGVIIVIGLIGGALGLLRPSFAFLVVGLLVASVLICAFSMAWGQHRWFAWLIPTGIQLPVGFIWSVGLQYLLESRRRKELRRAFGFYLSPDMAEQIANSNFDLQPGGKVVEATVMFTDLENFTTLSEDLDPAEVSEILIAYFRQTTKCILERHGTIIKYIGDAVMAAWGAPLEDSYHAVSAVEAACDLRSLTDMEVRGVKLRTRIGLHSGPVLAGNLGSEFRFDYTMIGDATNFASRLESLNKYLGTRTLISDAVCSQLAGQFTTRRLGTFVVAGKTHSVAIHELICRDRPENGEEMWLEVFEEGLRSFETGDLESARQLMRQTCALRDGTDGPAEFYLRRIASVAATPRSEVWTGIVALTEK